MVTYNLVSRHAAVGVVDEHCKTKDKAAPTGAALSGIQ